MKSKGLFSVDDLGRDGMSRILDRASLLQSAGPGKPLYLGRLVGLVFLEPSTRSYAGFWSAAVRLGASPLPMNALKYQVGMERPESVEDTVRVVSEYCDVLVLRLPDIEGMERAFAVCTVPVVNAGAGRLHPTQTLIDLFAIQRHFGAVDGLRIALVGDLGDSRSACSLLQALSYFAVEEVRLIAPPGRDITGDPVERFDKRRLTVTQEMDLHGVDVVYVAGLPPGVGDRILDARVRCQYALTSELAKALPKRAIVLCPLPRIDEIERGVDLDPRAWYFRQSADGLWVRMAVLDQFLSG
jgi:aspartate carbamoyltransferase catalytic subunit